jgi:hypothetical protein
MFTACNKYGTYNKPFPNCWKIRFNLLYSWFFANICPSNFIYEIGTDTLIEENNFKKISIDKDDRQWSLHGRNKICSFDTLKLLFLYQNGQFASVKKYAPPPPGGLKEYEESLRKKGNLPSLHEVTKEGYNEILCLTAEVTSLFLANVQAPLRTGFWLLLYDDDMCMIALCVQEGQVEEPEPASGGRAEDVRGRNSTTSTPSSSPSGPGPRSGSPWGRESSTSPTRSSTGERRRR